MLSKPRLSSVRNQCAHLDCSEGAADHTCSSRGDTCGTAPGLPFRAPGQDLNPGRSWSPRLEDSDLGERGSLSPDQQQPRWVLALPQHRRSLRGDPGATRPEPVSAAPPGLHRPRTEGACAAGGTLVTSAPAPPLSPEPSSRTPASRSAGTEASGTPPPIPAYRGRRVLLIHRPLSSAL